MSELFVSLNERNRDIQSGFKSCGTAALHFVRVSSSHAKFEGTYITELGRQAASQLAPILSFTSILNRVPTPAW